MEPARRRAGRVGAHGLRYADPPVKTTEEGHAEPAAAAGNPRLIAGRAIGSRTAITAAAVVVVLLIVAGLLAGGVFSGGKDHPTGPPTTASTPTTTTAPSRVTTTTPSQAAAKPSTLPVPTTKLQTGSQGTQVKQLQRALAHLGYPPGAVDGDFGPLTEAAVMHFQTASKLAADGVVGPLTLAALGKALRNGG